MKYLSVCSGIEAASVAWHPLGWEPLAFSEIEPFPRAVLAHHYPNVPLHGDFTVLRGMPFIADADVLVGGTPCQAFSVAGLRNSLADERGNLSLEFVRLADAIDDLRAAGGRDQSIIVWENVPGVLSVKDNAFGCFLAGLAGDVTPYVPPRGKWTNAGVVAGPQRAVAWRVLDAQYFGLAQRRRRVFVVASARDGFDPAAVLLEFEGVRRDTPPRREKGKGTAHATAPCLTSSGRGVERTGDTRGQDPVVAVSVASTGDISHCLNAGGMGRLDYETETLVAHSLRAGGFDASEDGTGRGTPLVPMAFSYKDSGNDAAVDLSPTLRSLGAYDANGGGQMAVAIPFDTTQITSPSNYSRPQPGDPCHPLAAGAHPPAIAFSAKDHGADATLNLSPTLRAGGFDKSHANSGNWMAVAITEAGDVASTLRTGGNDHADVYNTVAQHMAVRRLTPVECERLQGFPDNYTNVPWRKQPTAPDGPRYKALGNSMAVPCMAWIGRRIAEQVK